MAKCRLVRRLRSASIARSLGSTNANTPFSSSILRLWRGLPINLPIRSPIVFPSVLRKRCLVFLALNRSNILSCFSESGIVAYTCRPNACNSSTEVIPRCSIWRISTTIRPSITPAIKLITKIRLVRGAIGLLPTSARSRILTLPTVPARAMRSSWVAFSICM